MHVVVRRDDEGRCHREDARDLPRDAATAGQAPASEDELSREDR